MGSTVMFVSSSAFYTQIADPVIGGTYLTLLNTVTNLGGTWPRYFVLSGVDYFTKATCTLPAASELDRTPSPPFDYLNADVGFGSRLMCHGTSESAMPRRRWDVSQIRRWILHYEYAVRRRWVCFVFRVHSTSRHQIAGNQSSCMEDTSSIKMPTSRLS